MTGSIIILTHYIPETEVTGFRIFIRNNLENHLSKSDEIFSRLCEISFFSPYFTKFLLKTIRYRNDLLANTLIKTHLMNKYHQNLHVLDGYLIDNQITYTFSTKSATDEL